MTNRNSLLLVLAFCTGLLVGLIPIIIFFGEVFQGAQATHLSTPTFEESSAVASIVAVSSDGFGLVGKAIVEIKDGKGRVLFNTNPFVEPDTQYSIEVAKEVAERFTRVSLAEKDLVYSIEAPKAQLIGGPSAGAALCVATIAAIQGKKVRSDVAITGTIQQNGSIGQVGGILEKAQAAGESGFKFFLVPSGQKNVVVYEKKETEQRGKGIIVKKIYYEPKIVDLNELMFEQYGLQVIEVSNIEELASIALE
ncbi:MAG: S16 family serine protease [Candidatus Diapherotrites archaeon]